MIGGFEKCAGLGQLIRISRLDTPYASMEKFSFSGLKMKIGFAGTHMMPVHLGDK